ncbi:MAG TPA: hypothetical protein VF022_00125 [Rhodanobacteraceae bacterium]
MAAPQQQPAATELHVPQVDRRGAEQTYLTFPEWFLVFSPTEYAQWLRAHSPSRFPFFAHIGQFWKAYSHVIAATRGRYPFNGEYHTMICVIGVSTTIEYSIKGAYDTLIGRLTELISRPNATAEDRLATKVEQDYVDFIRVRPWYEFDFATPLKRLWMGTPMWGPHPLRNWERRYALTTEWLVKGLYGWLLGKATHSAYAVPKPTTLAVVTGWPDKGIPGLPELKLLRKSGPGGEALVALPRYQAFTRYAQVLARGGMRFVEIAGNRGTILVSVVAPANVPIPEGIRQLFQQPILTQPGRERRVLEVPVNRLSDVLVFYSSGYAEIEHAFDY